MNVCEVQGCINESKYFDLMGNMICVDHMVQSVESDNEALYEHFELIEEAAKQK